jgi:phytoene synthase
VVTADLDAAYASCERIARAHYENFPVASVLLPPGMRRHVAAVYAFARAADDFADEGGAPDGERLRLLAGWRERLGRAAAGDAQAPRSPGEPPDTEAIFAALGHTMAACQLPAHLLTDLLSAFAQDVTVRRYENWGELFDYARRSANPVGRLVLRIAGHDSAEFDSWSDAICTALQFTNFWQDFRVDFDRGRVYLPHGELIQQEGWSGEIVPDSVAVNLALRQAVALTRQLFLAGRPLCDALHGRLRYELRATWLGGTRILDGVEQQLLRGAPARPTLRLRDVPWFAWQLLTWAPR